MFLDCSGRRTASILRLRITTKNINLFDNVIFLEETFQKNAALHKATTFQASWPWVYDVAKPDHIVELCGRDFHYSPCVLLTAVGSFDTTSRGRFVDNGTVAQSQGLANHDPVSRI